MDIILVPGFWLDGSSWSKVTPPLIEAGHIVLPMTLPGLQAVDADRSRITLQDHIDAVVTVIDGLEADVVLVGHSGAAAAIYGATDARPERIIRCIYVDTWPLGEGGVVNDELPVVEGEIPFPAWEFFEDEDLVDLTDELRAEMRANAINEPKGAAYDQLHLTNEARLGVPATVICCEFPAELARKWMADERAHVAELNRIAHVELVDLPTGHWPQFTRPAELGQAILAAVDR